MKDNFGIDFNSFHSYTGVSMQEGRVEQDADWNEDATDSPASGLPRQILASFTGSGEDLAARADSLVHSPALAALTEDSPYRLDSETGSVKFGDGEHGRVPDAAGGIPGSYRHGSGARGPIAATPPFPAALAESVIPDQALLDTLAGVADRLSGYPAPIQEESAPGTEKGESPEPAGSETSRKPVRRMIDWLDEFCKLQRNLTERTHHPRSGKTSNGDDD
jgi:hypothetical protein